MRTVPFRAAAGAIAILLSACSDRGLLNPDGVPAGIAGRSAALLAAPSVRLSEIHYDNVGTDAGEAIEISGPAGTDVTGWTIVLYNGSGGATYSPLQTLAGSIPATCGERGVMVTTYAANGVQNGDPDGIALVNASGSVVEFVSYEGTFAATNGPASGMTSVDIGVAELTNTPVGLSLQRNADGSWNAPATSTFGACNDGTTNPVEPGPVARIDVAPLTPTITVGATQAFTASAFDAANVPAPGVPITWSSAAPDVATISATGVATAVSQGTTQITATSGNNIVGTATLTVSAPVALPPVRLSEIHYDNFGTDVSEAVEIEGPAGTDLTGYQVLLYNGNGGAVYNTRALAGVIASQCDGRGVVVLDYPTDGIQNGAPDGVALVNASGQVIEFLSYEGTFAATGGAASGTSSTDIGASEPATADVNGTTLQRSLAGTWALAPDNLGGCNGRTPGTPRTSFTFFGREPVDAPLPVGFEAQLFATVKQGAADVPFTWSSDTPDIATIDGDGIIAAKTAGTAVFRATTANGLATATYALPMALGVASVTAQYAGNTAFGDPVDSDPSNDLIIRRTEYTTSFSVARNIPNWVSYDLDPSHLATGADRCNCFTFDPELPQANRYTTNAYTGVGSVYNRGHLTRSADRTTGTLDNARTYYFSNVVPQAADNNQGPWAAFETYLGDLARNENKEVYIIAGASGNIGTLKDEGKVVIPANMWKVAVIMPHDQGLANFTSANSAQIIALIMPNVNGIRNVAWETYKTTVDAVEALSGYDLLSSLPDNIERAVESNTRPPIASINGPFASSEGVLVAMNATSSTDPDDEPLSYAWSFGDGSELAGLSVTHTYAQDGVYNVRLIVTDASGLADTTLSVATIANVAPTISAFGGATIVRGEKYAAAGSFSDSGADTWSATVNYGDAAAFPALPLNNKQFALAHTYSTAGSFTVTVRVADDDVTGTRTETVKVLSSSQALDQAIALAGALQGVGNIRTVTVNSLVAQLRIAQKQLDRGGKIAEALLLNAVLLEIRLIVDTGRATSSDVAALRSMITRTIASL